MKGSPQGASCSSEPAVAELADAVAAAVAGIAGCAVADSSVRLSRPPGCDGVLYGLQNRCAAVLFRQHLHDSTRACRVRSGSEPSSHRSNVVVRMVHSVTDSHDSSAGVASRAAERGSPPWGCSSRAFSAAGHRSGR